MKKNMNWYDEVNAIWQQVGQGIGAEFESIQPDSRFLASAFRGTLVKKFGESVITLEYHAHRVEPQGSYAVDVGTYTQMDARVGSDPSFSFEIGRHRPWRGRTVDILGNRYRVKSNDEEKARELLNDSKIRRLLIDALPDVGLNPLRRSQLVLNHRRLRFLEDSDTDYHGRSGIMATLAEDWRVPISDPYRIKALFQLFKAVRDRIPPPPPSPLPLTSGEQADDPSPRRNGVGLPQEVLTIRETV